MARMQRMHLRQQVIELLQPVRPLLLVQPRLGLTPVLHPQKLVVATLILHPLTVHLPSQPLPAVEPNLHLEGKPRLQPQLHPAKQRVPEIVVQHRAHARFADDRQPVGHALDVESPARLDALQHRRQPLLKRMGLKDLAGGLVLGNLTASQIAKPTSLLGPVDLRGRDDLPGDLLGMGLEIQKLHLVSGGLAVHPVGRIQLR